MYNYGAASALTQRNMANTVRQTASLVSGHDRIKEKQGEKWACIPELRIITWRPTNPYKPELVLSDEEAMWLTIHEAAHLEVSGSYDSPEWPDVDDPERFRRFVNFVEDIRIERWAKRRFPGTVDVCHRFNKYFDQLLLNTVADPTNPDMHLVDQVSFGYLNMAEDLLVWGSEESREFVAKTWDEIEQICLTSKSTAEVASRVLPIYQQIMEDPPPTAPQKSPASSPQGEAVGGGADGEPNEDGEEGDDGMYRSSDKEGNPFRGMSLDELLNAIAKDAGPEVARKLRDSAQSEKKEQRNAGNLAAQGIGLDASTERGDSRDWDNAKSEMRGHINTLSRRLQTRLRHNEQDTYSRKLKRGSFDGSKAHRSLRGDNRIFKKKIQIGRADYDFVLTFDCSGSQAPRVKEMLKSAVVASEAIERAGMGLSMITWDSGMRHFKPWNSPISRVKSRMGWDLMHADGGTVEGYALRVAEDLIRPRLNMGRKVVLITMTDGMTSAPEESKAIMADLKRKGVQSVGIGVMYAAPQHYDIKLSVNNAEELAGVLPGILKQVVKRG